MFIVRFLRLDGKPDEEYCYAKFEDEFQARLSCVRIYPRSFFTPSISPKFACWYYTTTHEKKIVLLLSA